jgi:hypothetical protein
MRYRALQVGFLQDFILECAGTHGPSSPLKGVYTSNSASAVDTIPFNRVINLSLLARAFTDIKGPVMSLNW